MRSRNLGPALVPTLIGIMLVAQLAAGESVHRSDVIITLLTPFGTPMDQAIVKVTMFDGTVLILATDSQGKIVVPSAPLGRVDVVVVLWRGMPINYKATSVTTGALIVENLGKLVVKVVGSRGQGLEGAEVWIEGGYAEITGTTDAAGRFVVELPAGTYLVTAEKGGWMTRASVTVSGGSISSQTLKVDIFMSIAGWEMSFSEFIGLLLLIAIIEIIVTIAIHEYVTWKRKRARSMLSANIE